MQSIGERLEEARKRRGISVREASEATKIRGDFLLGFESNQFDVGLPELYVRGFLRNYAAFLKVDGEKLVTDFTATVLGDNKPARKETRELFGRMELPERPRPAGETAAPAAQRRRPDEPPEPLRERQALTPEMANALKIGAIVAIGIILVLAIVFLIKAIISSPSSPSTEAPAMQSQPGAQLETITLIALDNVSVKVTQASDGVTLYQGPLARDERRAITKRGTIYITYDVGRNLNVEKGGRVFRMPRDGIGRSTFE